MNILVSISVMGYSKKTKKRIKLKDFIKKNPKLEALKKLPPDVIARAIKSKLDEDEMKKGKD